MTCFKFSFARGATYMSSVSLWNNIKTLFVSPSKWFCFSLLSNFIQITSSCLFLRRITEGTVISIPRWYRSLRWTKPLQAFLPYFVHRREFDISRCIYRRRKPKTKQKYEQPNTAHTLQTLNFSIYVFLCFFFFFLSQLILVVKRMKCEENGTRRSVNNTWWALHNSHFMQRPSSLQIYVCQRCTSSSSITINNIVQFIPSTIQYLIFEVLFMVVAVSCQ